MKFFVLLFFSGVANYMAFMGLAFLAGGGDPANPNPAVARCISVMNWFSDVMLNLHYLVMPIVLLVIVGLYFFISKEVALTMAKWSYLPAALSFLSIFLFFIIMAKLKA